MTTFPLRVLWLIKGLGPGGAERLLVSQATASDPGKFRYEAAYLLPWKRHLVAELDAAGVRTHCLDARGNLDLRWAWRLRRLLARGHYDVLHAHSPYPASVARLLARTLRSRPALVYTEHNQWPRHLALTRFANRTTMGLSDARIAVSAAVRESMSAGVRERVEVVVHGIDVAAVTSHRDEREAMRAQLGVGPHEVLAGTVANLRAAKAYPDLLAAARRVIDSGLPVRFVAVGQGPLERQLQGLARRLGLGDGFRFLGYREDALSVISALDLFVLSSVNEGLPIALLEALALGVPVVATRVGGIPEVVTDGAEGLLVGPGRVEGLADAICRLASDPARRAAMGAAAATRGAQYGFDHAARRLEEIYRAVAVSRREVS